MVYPVATIPVSTVLSIFYVHLLMMMIVTAIFVLSGFGITVYFVQLPYYMAACLIFTVVVATLLSALTAISRDFNHLIKATIQALFWLSPVLWSGDNLDGLLRAGHHGEPDRVHHPGLPQLLRQRGVVLRPVAVRAVLLGCSWSH